MHIGLILSQFPGCSETFIINKIKCLIDNDYKVSLFISSREKKKIFYKSVSIFHQININNKISLFIHIIIKFICHPIICIRFLRLENKNNNNWLKIIKNLIINFHIIGSSIDWIHFTFATTALGRENIASAMGIKSSVSLRGYDIGLFPHKYPGCYDLLWKRVDKVHTISDDLYKRAIELGLSQDVRTSKISPAINLEIFKPDKIRDLNSPIKILTVGRLNWKKGYDYALQALKNLLKYNIDFEYHIVGGGEYEEAIKYSVYQNSLTKKVVFKGRLEQDQIIDEMKWADLYLQPSIQEGFCNSVLEAQAMGLLCIVTDAEGLSENIINGKTGWVVPKRNHKAILDKILYVINEELSVLNLVRLNAIDRVKMHFDLSSQSVQFSNFFKK